MSDDFVITYDDEKHRYTLDGEAVPSVTTILDKCVAKPALTWWGMRVGMAAVIRAMASTSWPTLANANSPEAIIEGIPEEGQAHFTRNDKKRKKPKTLIEALAIDLKMSTNHVKEDAADRGTLIHNAMEQIGLGMALDEVQDGVPEEHHGYVAGLFHWWLDHEPEFLEQEIIVASRKHGYAGRFDTVVRYHAGPHQGKVALADLKTSKRVYLSHLVQLDAYEVAYEEMSLEPPGWRDSLPLGAFAREEPLTWRGFDAKHVIQVSKDGTYQLVESRLPKGVYATYVAMYKQLLAEEKLHPELK